MAQVRVGIGVFVTRGNTFLVGKRISKHGEGTWGLPGGYLEFGETFEDCAVREVREETGLVLDGTPAFITAVNNIFRAEKKHTVTIFMKAIGKEGEPHVLEPTKCAEWRWVEHPELLPQPLFLPLQQLMDSGYDPVRTSVLSDDQ